MKVNKDDDLWIRLDVRDFFLSGSPDDIVDDSLVGWPLGASRAAIADGLHFLLYNQFVRCKTLPDRLWRVTLGSGMGLPHSSDVMDWTFFSKAERYLLPVMSEFGVRNYYRYRDDVLIRASRAERTMAWAFVRKLKQYAGYFDIKVEGVSYDEADYLNIAVRAGGATYFTKAQFKESSLGRPLGEDSVHPPKIMHWPAAVLQRAMRLCTRQLDADEVKAILLHRFQAFGASARLMELLRRTEYTFKALTCRKAKPSVETWWCPLPYHPLYHFAISKAVADFNSSCGSGALFSAICRKPPPRIGIAWKNHVPTVVTLLQPKRRGEEAGADGG